MSFFLNKLDTYNVCTRTRTRTHVAASFQAAFPDPYFGQHYPAVDMVLALAIEKKHDLLRKCFEKKLPRDLLRHLLETFFLHQKGGSRILCWCSLRELIAYRSIYK